tara:strand:+ start:514 stop:759 length:246 start_codon:yes stop_codon:yes gene_type:complete
VNPEEEIEKVSEIFLNLGAESQQARIMARQLIKRAEQRAEEKNGSKVEELQKLLEVSVFGAQGRLKPSDEADFERNPPRNP